MNLEELKMLDKSLSDAKALLYDFQLGCGCYGSIKLFNAYVHIYRQSLAVSKQIDAYFAEVA